MINYKIIILPFNLVSPGKNVPYKALGFPSTYELLKSVPEAVRIKLTSFLERDSDRFDATFVLVGGNSAAA